MNTNFQVGDSVVVCADVVFNEQRLLGLTGIVKDIDKSGHGCIVYPVAVKLEKLPESGGAIVVGFAPSELRLAVSEGLVKDYVNYVSRGG